MLNRYLSVGGRDCPSVRGGFAKDLYSSDYFAFVDVAIENLEANTAKNLVHRAAE